MKGWYIGGWHGFAWSRPFALKTRGGAAAKPFFLTAYTMKGIL
jgi:hypothetical protein